MEIRHPEVKVNLVGEDGNAVFILARVLAAMRRTGVTEAERQRFYAEATSSDYDHLLQTVMAWVTTDPEPMEEET